MVQPATLEQMRDILESMEPGQHVTMNYDMLAKFFPPEAPGDDARDRANEFARGIGCTTEDRPNMNQVVFIKESDSDHGS